MVQCVPILQKSSVPPNVELSAAKNEAVFQMLIKGRILGVRLVTHARRADLDGLCEQTHQDESIAITCSNAKDQIADRVTQDNSQFRNRLRRCSCLTYTHQVKVTVPVRPLPEHNGKSHGRCRVVG